MNVALRPGMTLDGFLAWEEGQEARWEFDGFQPVAMVGGTEAHASITINLLTSLRTPEIGVTLPLAELYEGVIDPS